VSCRAFLLIICTIAAYLACAWGTGSRRGIVAGIFGSAEQDDIPAIRGYLLLEELAGFDDDGRDTRSLGEE